jgi:hypothetical protein
MSPEEELLTTTRFESLLLGSFEGFLGLLVFSAGSVSGSRIGDTYLRKSATAATTSLMAPLRSIAPS